MSKNSKGITLIALVITIIVLLILAGVSIAMLTGENGVLTQANRAKASQIEGQVEEEVKLAVQAAKMYSEEQAVQNSAGFNASENIAKVADKLSTNPGNTAKKSIIAVMQEDLTTSKGYATIESYTPGTDKESGVAIDGLDGLLYGIKITYNKEDYKKATNNTNAKIVAYIGVTNNNFSIGSIKTTEIK